VDDDKRRLLENLRTAVGDPRVIAAMAKVPREAFVLESSAYQAYEDIPLPIGEGQTISQPYIVALMLDALELRKTDKVLEIGTGSGYQAAVLAELAAEVVTIERIKSLADAAGERLRSLGHTRVKIFLAEAGLGWPGEAPYDGIVVAAGAPKLSREIMDQLSVGGRLVIPVGSMETQELMKVTRIEDGFSVRTLGACRFVPLIGQGAWPETRPEGEEGPA
jgi:protein-L-isoaspartate(D-aspartate) O-methyltransferase